MDHWLSMPVDPKKETPCPYGRVFRCKICSFGAIMPRPPLDAIADFYVLESYYTHGKSHFADGGRRTLWDRFRTHLAWRMDFGQPMTAEMAHDLLDGRVSDVCDIGCGSGQFATQMSSYGHRVVGVEFDIRAAVEAVKSGVELHQGSAEQLPEYVASRRFNLVIMKHVLEHCLDPARAFENASRLLPHGGLLICEVPNNEAAGFAHAGLAWEPLDVPRHMNFFVSHNLNMLCKTFGLRARSLYYSGYCRQFSNEWINTERRIWDAIERSGAEAWPRPVKNSRARSWKLLARTAWAREQIKYDSVGIVAEKV
jgi:SAM-dependent methyltransferase